MQFTTERVQEMLQGQRAVRRLPFPGLDGIEVGVRILLDEDVDMAGVEAQRYVAKIRADVNVDPMLLERERERQIIWRAFVDAEDTSAKPRPFFPADADVRKLDTVTVRRLFEIYEDHQENICPRIELDAAQVKELADALGKAEAPGLILAQFARGTLESFVLSMASRLRAS